MTLIKDSFCFECPVPLHWRACVGLCLLHCRVCYCAVRCRVLKDIKFLHFLFAQPCESAVHKVCIDLHKRPSWQRRVRCLFLTVGVTLLGSYLYIVSLQAPKTQGYTKAPNIWGKVSMQLPAADAHTLTLTWFFGVAWVSTKDRYYSGRKFSSWISRMWRITAIPLWIPMDSYGFFYQFLWIPLDSKPWNWRKEWQKAVLTCHCILWCCNLRESWIDHDRFVTNTMVSRDLHQKLWTGWLGSTSFPFSKLLEQTERKTSLQQANSHIVCWTWWFWEMKRGKVFGLFGCYLQPLSGSDLALEFFFFTWFREVWKRDREELIYIFMPQILHDVWKYVQKEFFVVGHSLEHVENMVQKWECVEVLEG